MNRDHFPALAPEKVPVTKLWGDVLERDLFVLPTAFNKEFCEKRKFVPSQVLREFEKKGRLKKTSMGKGRKSYLSSQRVGGSSPMHGYHFIDMLPPT